MGRLYRWGEALLVWHDRRPRATWGSPRGYVWAALVTATFFWMSNPLVFIPSFFFSFEHAKFWSKIAVLVTLPWLRLPRVPWPWLLFLGLCYASQLWSISDPNTDLSDLVYFQVALMAFFVAANCEPLVVCWGMALGGALVAGLSVYAYQHELPGASYVALEGVILAGIGTNQNVLSYTVTIAIAATLAIGWPRHVAPRVVWLLVLATNLYGVYLARSTSGFAATLTLLVAAGITAWWPWLRARGKHQALLWSAGGAVLLLSSVVVFATLQGDQFSTFSGRVPLWRATITSTMDEAPVLGSGWGAVWAHPWNGAPLNPVVQQIYDRTGYPLPHGHNFFLDVLPELGLAGVLIALLMVVYAVRTMARCGLRPPAPASTAGRLVLLTLAALMVFGITEPMLTVPLGWWSFALVVAVASQRQLIGSATGRRAGSPQRAHRADR